MKKFKEREKSGMTVEVRNNDINKALRILKKRMQTEGLFNEMREKSFFQTRGEKRSDYLKLEHPSLAYRNHLDYLLAP